MEIVYEVTEEAYIDFNLYHAQNSETVRKTMTMQRVLVPIIYVVMAIVLSFILDIPILFMVIPFLIMGILWAVFYPKYFYRHIRKSAKKLLREGKNTGILGTHTMIFTEVGLREISATGEELVSWAGIENFGEDTSNLYLYNSGLSAYIIPKSSLVDVDRIRQFLLDKINNES
ncbi:YcxB family protein [Planococcus donghaensis]|uniref:YcxB-like C-terminal domain-containing protein n=1 Tax=Planococcus donghaensis TaxID=414778 RepID=A0A1C7EKH0_9BACL|nr:YcxB family protein [Planococcus donghaensis]ANU24156.1 hypothetical protein BCM40_12695 [Planococcus donghaensis]